MNQNDSPHTGSEPSKAQLPSDRVPPGGGELIGDSQSAPPSQGPRVVDLVSRTLAQAQALECGGASAHRARALQHFGQSIAAYRRARGLNRSDAAKRSTLTQRQISLIEWGLYQPQELQRMMGDIAALCGLSESNANRMLGVLLAEDPDPPHSAHHPA